MKRTRKFRLVFWLGLLGTGFLLAWAVLPALLPRVVAWMWPDIVFRVAADDGARRVFLTIDDGPSTATPQILEVLARHHVKATFFVITDRISDRAQIEAILAGGHAIGHHMRTSRAAAKMSLEFFQSEFDAAAEVLKSYGDVQLFRPPSGIVSSEQVGYAAICGCVTVLGTAYPFDAHFRDADCIRWLARWLATDGAIIILHDGAERGRTTAEVLDRLIPELRARGFEFGDLAAAL
jgi:peptidoglycan-N-acetylglucosamine deacetylase